MAKVVGINEARIDELLKAARTVLESGDREGAEALALTIRAHAHTISVQRRIEEVEKRITELLQSQASLHIVRS